MLLKSVRKGIQNLVIFSLILILINCQTEVNLLQFKVKQIVPDGG